jgi:hypothetical protein
MVFVIPENRDNAAGATQGVQGFFGFQNDQNQARTLAKTLGLPEEIDLTQLSPEQRNQVIAHQQQQQKIASDSNFLDRLFAGRGQQPQNNGGGFGDQQQEPEQQNILQQLGQLLGQTQEAPQAPEQNLIEQIAQQISQPQNVQQQQAQQAQQIQQQQFAPPQVQAQQLQAQQAQAEAQAQAQQQFQGQQQQQQDFSPEELARLSLIKPKIADVLQKGQISQQRASEADRRFEQADRKFDQSVKEADRRYHSQTSDKQEEKIAGIRESVPKKKSALRHSRSAVESGEVGAFSINQLADSIGGAAGDAIRTSQGAALATAGKENLLGNMARVSAKAQNQWFEERLASMFPKVGQSIEANLTTQEMLEGEVILEEAYVKKYDELADSDVKLYGYPRNDIDKRARRAVEHLEEVTFNRSAYRMRELQESEMGRGKMMKGLNKKVPNGTPMTLQMGSLFLDKYKDPSKALKAAKKLGYKVPNAEDLQLYNLSSDEFAQRVGEM